MPSATKKTKVIIKRKVSASGARRKKAIRHDYNLKVLEIGRKLGLEDPEALANAKE